MNSLKYDNIVIGGGFAGLLSALFSAASGKRTMLVTKGAGSLIIGGGTIDMLGRTDAGQRVVTPLDSIKELPSDHPYSLVGCPAIENAVKAFLHITEKYGYRYRATGKNFLVPTALGTLKPAYAIPLTMDISNVLSKHDIYVLGIDGLKDFDPYIVADGLKKQRLFSGKSIKPVSIKIKERGARDFSALDVASFLECGDNFSLFIDRFMHVIPSGAGVIMPPVLGAKPCYKLYENLIKETGCGVVESSVIAPAVTGYRLRTMLLDILRQFETDIIENASAIGAHGDGVCTHIDVSSPAGRRSYRADKFIIATGGFYGGGIVNENGHTYEAITGMTVFMPDEPATCDFSSRQEFAKCGTLSESPYSNMHFVGRVTGGTDSAYEISGNGIALATAYAASKKV